VLFTSYEGKLQCCVSTIDANACVAFVYGCQVGLGFECEFGLTLRSGGTVANEVYLRRGYC